MDDLGRHSRHQRFPGIGEIGQQRIANARIAIAGCGALGSRSAELLARAGVATGERGLLRLIDRDTVDYSNLQRQALFDTSDAREVRPKALAAARHLAAIDPGVRTEAHVRDLSSANAAALMGGVDLIVDGTDNFRARFLINDLAVREKLPWIYGGAVASRGVIGAFVPGRGACLRCLLEAIPALGAGDTCETAGVITPIPSVVASLQVAWALRWIVDATMPRGLHFFDLWDDSPSWTTRFEEARPDPDCRACGRGEFPALEQDAVEIVTLCGRNSVQIFAPDPADLEAAENRLRGVTDRLRRHSQSLTATFDEARMTLFADGRIIVEGTTDPLFATSLVARYLGG